ncbi:MAG: hypothetical protein KC657_36185 [Myxococcales bacterium]|nr:hypothetical protein [Myxococcales bacterium]
MALRPVLRALLLASAASAAVLACSGGGDPAAEPGDAGADDAATGADVATGTDGGGGGGDGAVDASADVANDATLDAAPVDAGPPAVRYIGRFDRRDAAGPKCAWPGCRIVANFDGTGVSVTLDEIVLNWMDGAPSEWDVIVDGALQPKLVTTPGVSTYVLAAGLPAGRHSVELYRRSEALNGTTQFMGFDFGAGALLPPPLPATRRIEIIGDSQAAAFGLEGVDYPQFDCPGPDGAAKWQNFRRSFGGVLGATFGAEVHGLAYSGKGIAKNLWRPDLEPMPMIYDRSDPMDATSTWSFAEWQPDVIVAMIGTNDFGVGEPNENGAYAPSTPEEVTDAFRAFATLLRAKNPNAHIWLTVSASATDTYPAGRMSRTRLVASTTTVAAERVAAGDTKTYAFAVPEAADAELTGCSAHGNPAHHARIAADLAAQIKAKTGWN